MKFIVAFFILGTVIAKGQLVYVTAEKPFLISNAAMQTPVKACWVNLNGASHLYIRIADGIEVKRAIPAGIKNPIYVVVKNRLRYRPNLQPQAADTVTCRKNFQIPDLLLKTDTLTQTISTIKQLEFEYERAERVAELIIKPGYSCEEKLQLINCLNYDASRAELLKKIHGDLDAVCYEQLLQSLPEAYRKQLK